MKKMTVIVMVIIVFIAGGILNNLYKAYEVRAQREIIWDYVYDHCSDPNLYGMAYACVLEKGYWG